jgi:hypothetical protein
MTDTELIEAILDDAHATDRELDLAERLATARVEMVRMTASWEDDGGRHA